MDTRELLLPLMEGIRESPPFEAFMRKLVGWTGAQRGALSLALGEAKAVAVHAGEPPLAIEALGLRPFAALRKDRVYALDELLDYDSPDRAQAQRAALAGMGVRYARLIRVSAGGFGDAGILLVREDEDFAASAAATLSTLAPHLCAALRTFAPLDRQRARTALAESALARLGIGQLAFDESGGVTAADPVAEAALSFAPGPGPGRRLQLLPEAARALETACAEIAAGRVETCTVRIGERDLLLRPSEHSVVVGSLRIARRESPRGAVSVIAATLGLSEREAALAHALTLGETIDEAGRRLRLTRETARNYSKRIYAKTGVRGQADLVRLVLTGLVPLS